MRGKILALFVMILGGWAIAPTAIKFAKPYLEERLPFEFSIDKIALDMKSDFATNTPIDLSALENQEFRYLGHGGQAVAFASPDDRYVLKFFLTKQLQGAKRYPIPKPTHWFHSHRKARLEQRQKTRFISLMKAMRNTSIAFDKIKEKTGIIALHLNAGNEHLPVVTLVDNTGKKHMVDLARASFVFQHKAILVPEKISTLHTGEEKEALIASLSQFFVERAKEGFIDIERSFMIDHNYGFLGDLPIQLDVGNIEYLETLRNSPDAEIKRMHGLLFAWASEIK